MICLDGHQLREIGRALGCTLIVLAIGGGVLGGIALGISLALEPYVGKLAGAAIGVAAVAALVTLATRRLTWSSC